MWNVWEAVVRTGFCWGDLRERDHLENSCEWEKSIKWIFEKCDGAWSGLIWLRMGTGGGLL
jgi:hypothetical protein